MSQQPNADMRRAWDGPSGDVWTDNEDYYNNGMRRHTPYLIAAAAIGETDRVLDIGCGTGQVSRLAAEAASKGSVLGVDLSRRMLERAAQRAAEQGLSNVSFEVADAQVHPFEPAAFDVAISRNGVMFFDDPVAAFTNIARSIVPGGRLAFLCWGEFERNEWVLAVRDVLAAGRDLPRPLPNTPGPFALADSAGTRDILARAGFAGVSIEEVPEPLFVGADPAAAFDAMMRLEIVAGLLADLDAATRDRVLDDLRALLADRARPDGVWFGTTALLVTAAKP